MALVAGYYIKRIYELRLNPNDTNNTSQMPRMIGVYISCFCGAGM